ncbi:NINE protein [Lentzea sp. NEAU-D7]|uniref:NINE protein n=1 Tax=Lentzea sp. NEAU-D7 TaxID=2994667 RepID=UPI00224AE1A3|nr:NINE protein [Lentzea sp. NEAU-D7]MCX2952032.1 NINE protein [Lentzea sp. NEAU-D7]
MSEAFGPEQQRIGNQQREEAITALNDHFAMARLDIGEYQDRVNRASGAQSYAELAELFRDLPQPHPPFLAPPSVPFAVPPAPPGYPPQQTQPYYPPPTGPQYAVPPPPPGYGSPGAPYGYDPITGVPLSDKSKIAAGVLQLFLGNLGIGRFYTGHTGIAVAQLLTCGGCGIWSLIDGIIILVNGGTDAQGRKLRD